MSQAEKFRAALEADETDIQAFVGLCHIAEQDSDFEYLAELYKFRAQVIKDRREIADLFFKAGEVFLDKLEDLNRGVEALLQGFENDKSHAGIGDRLDVIYREADDWEATAQILDQRIQALEEMDANGTMVTIRSDLHQQLGEIFEKVYTDPEKAMKNYRKAIELDRTNLPALYSARELYYASGKFKNAAKLCELEARAEKDPERRIALYTELSRLLDEHLSDPEQAVLALKRALKLGPDNGDTKLELSQMIARTPLTKDSEKNHKWACDFLLKAAKKAEAAEALELASAAFIALPTNEGALSFLKSLGQTDGLVDAYKVIIELGLDMEAQAPHIRTLAKLYIEEVGDPEQALKWLKKLEPLGKAEDKRAIQQLSKGVETRASQMPAPAESPSQPETIDDVAEEAIEEVAEEIVEEAAQETPVAKEEDEPELRGGPDGATVPSPAPLMTEAPMEPPDGMSNDEYVKLLQKDADKARRSGDDATAEERMLLVLDYSPQDQKSMVYLERRFRARSDWLSLRDLLLRFDGAAHVQDALQTVKLREAARISEEQLSDVEGAIQAWAIIRKNNPSLRDAGDALSRLLSQAERWEELLEIVELEAETTKSRTKRVEAYRRVADINRIRLGNSQAATEAFQKVLELSPEDESALEALDEMYLRDQNYDELVLLLNKRAELTRDRETKRNFLVRALLALRERLDRPEDAYTLAKDILAISPNDNEVLEIMESVDEEGEHWGRLLNTLDLRSRATDDPADKAHFLRKKSAIAIEQFHDEDASVKALQDVLKLIPDDVQAMDQLSEIYSNSGEWEELVAILRIRLAAEEDEHAQAEIHKEIARILENNLDNPDEALISWRKVIDIEEDVESLGALLRYYERNEQWKEFCDVLDRQAPYAEDHSERAGILFRRAEVLFEKLDSREEAIESLNRIINEVDPSNISTLALLRQIFIEGDDYKQAASMLDQQISHTEDEQEKKDLLIVLGDWSKKELDDMERAADAFEKAFAIDSEDAKLLEELDEVYTTSESWDKLLDLIEQQFKVETDDEKKLDLLVRAAALCEEKLDDSQRAWTWYRVAFNTMRHVERTIEIVEEAAYRLELWQQLIDEVYGAMTRNDTDPDIQVGWWLKIATVFEEKQNDVGKALEAVLRAFGLSPENEELLDRVDHLAVLAKNWQRLSTVYGVLASRTEVNEDKIELLVRYAQLLAAQEEQKSQAFDVSLKAFELEPTSEDLLGVVEVIGEKAERWDDLVRVYSVCLRFVESNEKKADLMMRAAAVLRDKKEDHDGALQQIIGMLRVDPFDENIANRAWTEVQGLEQDVVPDSRGTYWTKFIETYRELAEENRKDRIRQAELLTVVAKVYSDELEDVQTAFDCLKEIQQLNPRDEAAISKLEELASEHNYWEAVTSHYRDILDETFEMEVATMFHKRLARILEEELDLPEEAAEHYWQIIQLDVSDLNGYEKLLDYYTKAEKWNELVNLLERQLDNTKNDDDKKRILLHIASIWENNIKNRYEARDWYDQIITIWPDNEEAKEGYARLAEEKADEDDDDDDDDDMKSLISIPPPATDKDEESEEQPEEASFDDSEDYFGEETDDESDEEPAEETGEETGEETDDESDEEPAEETGEETGEETDEETDEEPVEETDDESGLESNDEELDEDDELDLGEDEPEQDVDDLIEEEAQDADDLIEEEAQDADDLIEEEAQDADDLIEEEAQDADDLIEEEAQDADDLIEEESIDANSIVEDGDMEEELDLDLEDDLELDDDDLILEDK